MLDLRSIMKEINHLLVHRKNYKGRQFLIEARKSYNAHDGCKQSQSKVLLSTRVNTSINSMVRGTYK